MTAAAQGARGWQSPGSGPITRKSLFRRGRARAESAPSLITPSSATSTGGPGPRGPPPRPWSRGGAGLFGLFRLFFVFSPSSTSTSTLKRERKKKKKKLSPHKKLSLFTSPLFSFCSRTMTSRLGQDEIRKAIAIIWSDDTIDEREKAARQQALMTGKWRPGDGW